MVKPVVIGLYGISYTGKCTLWYQLQEPSRLGNNDFKFINGVDMLSVSPRGVAAMQNMSRYQQGQWREQAIKWIGEKCARGGGTVIMTGQALFDADFQTFTHILYLERSIDEMYNSRANDATFPRDITRDELQRWQQAEIALLQHMCLKNGVVFGRLKEDTMLTSAHRIIEGIYTYSEEHNRTAVINSLATKLPLPQRHPTRNILVLDGDRLLAAEETGKLFWRLWSEGIPFTQKANETPLQTIFGSSKMGYTFTAYQQAAVLYETLGSDKLNACCERVAAAVTINPAIKQLLSRATTFQNVEVVLLTTGLKQIWDRVLAREGLENVVVLGSGLVSQGYIITPAVKVAVVQALQAVHFSRVWALGDSPLDLNMMRQANMAVVVVGSGESRSVEMLRGLENAVGCGMRARQVLLSGGEGGGAPLLDQYRLPSTNMRDVLCNLVGRSVEL